MSAPKVLLLTNMAASADKPFIGQFVRNQHAALSALLEDDIAYCDMPDAKHRILRYPKLFLRFVSMAFRARPDIIHVHFYFPTVIFAVLYKKLFSPSTKIVVTFHGSDVFLYNSDNRLYRYCLQYVAHGIFVSRGLKVLFEQKFGTAPFPSDVLCAGVSSSFFTSSVSREEKKYDLAFVGTVDINKGTDRLIAILNAMPQDLSVAIAGRGPAETLFAEKLNKRHAINRLGSLTTEPLIEVLQRSRFLINLSRNESFGLAMTEAMALGVPVIATDTPGSQEQVIHGKNGYILPQDTTEFVTQAVKTVQNALAMMPPDYEIMNGAAKTSVQHTSVNNVVHVIKTIYNALYASD